MPKNLGSLARSLSMDEIKALLAIKEQLVEAEAKRAKVERELRTIDGQIVQLVRKLATRTPKPGRAASGRTATRKRRPGARVRGRAQSGRGRGRGGKSLEQVVVDLIHAKGGRMQFPDIKSTIVRRKLFATRSKNFDNVLRRTISTSRKIKRVARGTYSA